MEKEKNLEKSFSNREAYNNSKFGREDNYGKNETMKSYERNNDYKSRDRK